MENTYPINFKEVPADKVSLYRHPNTGDQAMNEIGAWLAAHSNLTVLYPFQQSASWIDVYCIKP